MEFVDHDETVGLLAATGVVEEQDESGRKTLRLTTDERTLLHLRTSESTIEPLEEARVLQMDAAELVAAVPHIIHKMHLNEVLLFPVAKWRSVFDAVAFSLAENEEWQEIDAAATVELNSRDPLVCEPGDSQTLVALIRALLSDGESSDQGLLITTIAAPILVEIVPQCAIRISIGNHVLADKIAETIGVSS